MPLNLVVYAITKDGHTGQRRMLDWFTELTDTNKIAIVVPITLAIITSVIINFGRRKKEINTPASIIYYDGVSGSELQQKNRVDAIQLNEAQSLLNRKDIAANIHQASGEGAFLMTVRGNNVRDNFRLLARRTFLELNFTSGAPLALDGESPRVEGYITKLDNLANLKQSEIEDGHLNSELLGWRVIWGFTDSSTTFVAAKATLETTIESLDPTRKVAFILIFDCRNWLSKWHCKRLKALPSLCLSKVSDADLTEWQDNIPTTHENNLDRIVNKCLDRLRNNVQVHGVPRSALMPKDSKSKDLCDIVEALRYLADK